MLDVFLKSESDIEEKIKLFFLKNKYSKKYFNIINKSLQENRKKKIKDGLENHHIIPKSLGGSDENKNRVLLTVKEYFICHRLLVKMVENKKDIIKMKYAVVKMIRGRKERLSIKQIEIAKIIASEAASLHHKNSKRKPLTEEHKQKIRITKALNYKSRNHSENTKIKQSGEEYHNPISLENKRFKTHLGEIVPNGWIKGRIIKKRKWITNGIENRHFFEDNYMPNDFYIGRTILRDKYGKFSKKESI